jgi:hypothetical protein
MQSPGQLPPLRFLLEDFFPEIHGRVRVSLSLSWFFVRVSLGLFRAVRGIVRWVAYMSFTRLKTKQIVACQIRTG